MSQIALVSHQHDDNVCVGMIAELFQPACDVLVGLVLGDVVDEEGADCATVVGTGDGAVALLAGGIPDLCLDGLVVDLDAASGEFDADGRLAVEIEFVASETREKVRFTNARVSNKDHLEEELRMVVSAGMDDHMALAARSSSGEQGARTSYSSLAMFAVGYMGWWRWSGGGVRRYGGLVGGLYAAGRKSVVARVSVVEGRTMRAVCAKRSGCGRVGGSEIGIAGGLFV